MGELLYTPRKSRLRIDAKHTIGSPVDEMESSVPVYYYARKEFQQGKRVGFTGLRRETNHNMLCDTVRIVLDGRIET